MTADQLVRLYPRKWRERYADEFVETVGSKTLHPQQIIDIAAGALDAWISFRSKTASVQAEGGGEVMVQQWKMICATNSVRYTKRDALISAGVLILGTILLSAAGIFLDRESYPVPGDVVKSLAFPVALTVSMPFAILKGQPKKTLWFTMIVSTGLLFIATLIATKI
jgi:hypothetical protein